MKLLRIKMEEDLIKLVSNLKRFNSELMELNIKYSESIEELQDRIITFENQRDFLQSTLSDIKADIKYAIQYGDGNGYLRKKYFRSDNSEKEEN